MSHSTCIVLLATLAIPFVGLALASPDVQSKATAAGFVPVELRCEDRIDPLGIDAEQPRLQWILQPTTPALRGLRQTGYQVLAASTLELLHSVHGDLWDSGHISNDASGGTSYAGVPLTTGRQVFWKVRVFDADGNPSDWSKPATWTMGVLEVADWHAQWITSSDAMARSTHSKSTSAPGLLLRRDVSVKPNLKRAIINVCGLGCYSLSVNGNRLLDDLLAPGWTAYRKTVLYQTYDVTSLIKAGQSNTLGLSLGHGMYDITAAPDHRYVKFRQSFGPLQAIAQLRLEYADGSTDVVGTDTHWQTGPSPITFENQFAGEDKDARLEMSGWNSPGFSASTDWMDAIVGPGPGGTLRGASRAAPPITAHEVLEPVKTTQPRPGTIVYDLGQNAAIRPRLTVHGPAGASVRIIPTELLNAKGLADRASCTQDGVRPAWWGYTLKGGETESWFAEFFYQGARYLQVDFIPAHPGDPLPVIDHIEGVVLQSASSPVGEFSCSNELFNRIYTLVRWAQRSNMMSVMTDCPHREKLPWLEETHLNGPSLRYNFDMGPLLGKAVGDMADSQLDNGFVPNIAPEYFLAHTAKLDDPFRNSPEWGSAMVLVPWQQYEFTGDPTLLRHYFPAMKHYVDFLRSTAKANIIETGLGDWYDLGPKPPWGSQLTPPALTATAFYYHDSRVLAQVAELLGDPDASRQFEAQAGAIRDAFNNKFFDQKTGQYATGSQTANSLALVMGLAEPQYRSSLLQAIVNDVRKHGNGLTAGDVGYRYLLRALADAGRSDVIFDMNNQSDRPGYGMQLKRGATSLTEKWDASVGNFGSQNHFMLGQINEWLFHDLAGIQYDPTAPGFRNIILHPAVVGDITSVSASYRSVRGTIVSKWTRNGSDFTLNASIPPGATATVILPTLDAASITESGIPIEKAPGVTAVHQTSGNVSVDIGSGSYLFRASLSHPASTDAAGKTP